MATTSITDALASSKQAAGRTKLASTFDSFLKLLTTQLANQDPLSPMDTDQFTQQLVQFTGVEQALNTNDKLDQLIGLQSLSKASTAVGYLGTTIEAEGKSIFLSDGRAEARYELPSSAAAVTVTISDASGKVVFTGAGDGAKGARTFVWDGRNSQGIAQPDGVYSVAISASDGNGAPIQATTRLIGRVTAVETGGSDLILSLGGVKVPLANVTSVSETGI